MGTNAQPTFVYNDRMGIIPFPYTTTSILQTTFNFKQQYIAEPAPPGATVVARDGRVLIRPEISPMCYPSIPWVVSSTTAHEF